MRSLIWLVVVIMALASYTPASAVTIKPGVYKLEWKVPNSDGDVCFAGRAGANLYTLSPEEAVEMTGLVSSRPYSGKTDSFRIVLDESKGNGEGYDTAYVSRVGETGLDKAVKILLKQEDYTLKPSSPSGALFELNLGSGDTQVTRKAALGLEVYLETDEVNNFQPAFAMLTMRGGWYGKVATDEGALAVQSVDLNENCVYGDQSVINFSSKLPEMGDAIVFGDSPVDFDDYSNVVYLGKVISYGGRLYECSISPTGESLEIKDYEGETGILSFDPRDGFDKKADCRKVVVYTHAGVFTSSNGSELVVPPGDYRCLTAVVTTASVKGGNDAFSVLAQRKSPVTVTANEKTSMSIGGPVDVLIDQESDILDMSLGAAKIIKLNLKLGDDDLVGLEGSCKACVNIRDEKGKLLSSEHLDIKPSGVLDYYVRIPSHWKTGTYTLGVAFESASYQKPAYAHKMLRVEK